MLEQNEQIKIHSRAKRCNLKYKEIMFLKGRRTEFFKAILLNKRCLYRGLIKLLEVLGAILLRNHLYKGILRIS